MHARTHGQAWATVSTSQGQTTGGVSDPTFLKLCSRQDKESRPSPAVCCRSGLSLPGYWATARPGYGWQTSGWEERRRGRRGGGGRGHRNERWIPLEGPHWWALMSVNDDYDGGDDENQTTKRRKNGGKKKGSLRFPPGFWFISYLLTAPAPAPPAGLGSLTVSATPLGPPLDL